MSIVGQNEHGGLEVSVGQQQPDRNSNTISEDGADDRWQDGNRKFACS